MRSDQYAQLFRQHHSALHLYLYRAIFTRNTGNYSNNKYLTQHTIDRKEEISPGTPYTLQNWFSSGYKVYGYEIDKAPN